MTRSLVWKLTLAFLLVSLIGVGLVAIFVRWRTQTAFNRLVLDQNQQILAENLTQFYEANGSWAGVESVFTPGSAPVPPPRNSPFQSENRRAVFTLVDTQGTVVIGGPPEIMGRKLPASDMKSGIAIEVGGRTVGWLLFNPRLDSWRPGTPEGEFLIAFNRAILFSALIAVLIALVLGGLLAATLTRSLRELTAATKEVAKGKLGQQVQVRTEDELGDLARSFNQMSIELARSNQLRRQMTADIAHDLRNPLSVIMGYSEALSDGKLQPTSEMLSVLHTETEHLNRLIEDFKTLSLADAGELPLILQQVTPDLIFTRISKSYAVQAEKKSIRLQSTCSSDLPEIRVDVERMIQVLGNLVSNALRYTPNGGKILLTGKMTNGDVLFEVSDNGAGIAAEDLPYVFERSFRGDKARHQQDGEAGLGLAIAKSIVEAHGGAMTVTSIPGEGTVFSIRLHPANK